jgi:hypothetical protein
LNYFEPYFEPETMGPAVTEAMAAQLIEHDLVDEYRLMIEPILLGCGSRVFPDDGRARTLGLVSTTTGTAFSSAPTGRPAVHPLSAKRSCGARHNGYALVQVTGGTGTAWHDTEGGT